MLSDSLRHEGQRRMNIQFRTEAGPANPPRSHPITTRNIDAVSASCGSLYVISLSITISIPAHSPSTGAVFFFEEA